MAEPFLGTVSSFKEAYPNVKTLQFTGVEHGDLRNEYYESKVAYSENSIVENIPCGNPKCQQGGYNIRAILISLTHSRDTSYGGEMHCNGHEGTPKGRKIGDLCSNYLEYNIELSYV